MTERRLTVTYRFVFAVLVATTVTCSPWCCSASDNTGYFHVGCYYEVHKCGSPPYYIENQRPNTFIFDICLNFTSARRWKSFGIQTLQQKECITGPHFHTPLNPTCFKPGNCSKDRGNVTLYSYDLYVKGNLSVLEPPSFIQKPNSTTVVEGSLVTFICNATGSPVPFILWYKDGQPLAGRTLRYQISNDNRTLRIKKAGRTDEGIYSCNISNSIGPALSSSANLTVNYPPKILVSPNDATSVEENAVNITCYLEGKPVSNVTWFKDGTQVILANDKRISVSPPISVSNTSATMTITNLNRTDEGNYSCQAVNDVGSNTSSAALLIVNYPSVIFVPPTDTTSVEKDNVSMTCYLEGKPISDVTWFKDGTHIIPANDNRISVSPPTSVSNTSTGITITNVTRADEGNYSCHAVNDVGNDTSSAALLTVNYGINIAVNPKGQTKNEGESVMMKCEVVGKPAPAVTWFKDGNPLTVDTSRINVTQPTTHQRTNVSLTIIDLKKTDEGGYSCNVKNSYSEKNSTAALLTVNYVPKILVPPTNQTVVETSSVSLTCYLEGKPISDVTWFKDGTPIIPANDKRISVSPPTSVSNTSTGITITNVTRADEGNYSCQAVNDVGNDNSSAALLTVNFPPKILVHPTSQTVVETAKVSMACFLEGKPLSTVIWLKDGNPITPANDDRLSMSPPTSVSNTSTTMSLNVNRTDEGSYTCQAVNDVGNDTSSAALLTVNYGINIPVNPKGQTKNEGESVMMTCEVVGKPAPTVTWFKDGNPLTIDTSRMNVTQPTTHQRTNVSLTIIDLKRTDLGGYSCNVKNSYGEKSSTAALLTVNYVPKILVPPTNQTVVETSSVSLTCYLEGKPISDVTWFKDGTPIIPANDTRISVSSSTSVSNTSTGITITNVNRTDEGSYTCQAVNDVGNDTSSAALLTVNYETKIFTGPRPKIRKEGDSVTLECEVEGKPVPDITWLKNNKTFKIDNNRIFISQPKTHNRTVAAITIKNLRRTDEGRYSCRVNNSLDEQISGPALMIVNYKPQITKQLTNKTVTEGKSVSFVCHYDGRPKPNVTWFKDSILISNEQDKRINISADGNTMTIKKTKKDDEGRYECRVENHLGYNISSSSLSVQHDGSFAVRPRNKTYVEGQRELILTCKWNGLLNAKIMINWLMKKNNLVPEVKISTQRGKLDISQDGTQLTIINLRRTDQGSYRCKAYDDGRSPRTSSYGYVNVNYKPKVLQSPLSLTKNEREPVTLTCKFEGKPFPSVTWLKNGQKVKPNSNGRMKSTVSRTHQEEYIGTAKLEISNLRREDQGHFSCSIKNKITSALSDNGSLEITYPPVVFSSPQNISKNESDQVQLSCTMEGNPKPTVLWQKDGHNINQDGRIIVETKGNASLWESIITIKEIKSTDDGDYVCVATNVANGKKAVRSKTGRLVVNFLYDVSFSNSNPYVLTLGQKNALLQCNAVGFPQPVLSWHKEDTIKSVPQIKNSASRATTSIDSSGQTGSQLNLTASDDGVSYEEAGNYTCVAYSKTLNKTTRRTVEVLFKPEIQHKPTDLTVVQGKQASFYCNATGVPEPVISWRFSGGSNPKHTGNKLLIDNVQNTYEYEGRYTCVASSRAGKAEESATLTVLVPPTKKAALPQKTMLQLGQTLQLKCDVYGDPEPSFEWTKRSQGKTEKIPNQENYYLVIPDVRVKDAAYYGCTAKNKVGTITLDDVFVDVNSSFTRASLDIINSGQNFNGTEGASTTIRCIASSKIYPIKVRLLRDGKELKTQRDVSDDKKVVNATLDLTSVTTDDSGVYTCVARNRQKEVKANVNLAVTVPIKVEIDVSLKNKTFTKELYNNTSEEYKNLRVEFIEEMTKVYVNETGFVEVEVLGFSNGSVSVRFRVVYRIKVETPEEKPPPDTKVRIANVLVRRVKNTDGIVGKLVLKADSLKPRVKPPAPRNLTADNIKKTSMTIHWSPSLYHDHYSVKNYVVKCKAFASSWKNLEVDGQLVNTLFLKDLEPDTSYSIKAHAVNHVGEGIPSKVIEVKTHSDFWSKFTKIFVPLFVLLVIGVIVLLYVRRQRARREAKLATEVEGKRCYDEFQDGAKKLEFGDAMEMVELPMRCRLIPRENLELGKELGAGQFGVVYKGLLKDKGEDEDVPCAVKMLKPGASESDYRDLFNELEIMCSVDEHPNIVNLLGACKGGGEPLYVVVEFAENGCLLDYIRENRITTVDDDNGNKEEVSSLDNKEKIRIALDIAKGMAHLASHKCVHRDLAARNVLLGEDRIAKVADFGLARDVYEQGFYEKSSTGGKLPAKWMSIEALETLKATSESDVWSFGILLWEIETGGKMPYAGLAYMDLLKALKSGVRLQKPSNCSEELYSIMKDCWEANPEKRPTFELLSLVLDNLLMAFLEDNW